MRALATCSLVRPGRTAVALNQELEALNCGQLVLDAAVSNALLLAWLPDLRSGGPVQVAAVHAPCPPPDPARSDEHFVPEDLRLAAPDPHDRADALRFTLPSFDTAELVDATVVVVEGGPLPLAGPLDRLRLLDAQGVLDSQKGRQAQEAARQLRREAGALAVDAWSFALEALVAEAERRGLLLVVSEQREAHWVGSPGEIATILARFEGAPLAWWAAPLGRYAGVRLLGAWEDAPAPDAKPRGWWWRLPGDSETEMEDRVRALVREARSGEQEDMPVPALHVLAADAGTLEPWHRRIWDALARSASPA